MQIEMQRLSPQQSGQPQPAVAVPPPIEWNVYMAEILATDESLVEATLQTDQTQIPDGPTRDSWHQQLKNAVRSGQELLKHLGTHCEWESSVAASDFPVFVPHSYLQRIRPGDANDPLLKQVLASREELLEGGFGLLDPVGDQSAELLPGLLKKYRRRALLITSGACAIHCRYCFRRHYDYASAPTGLSAWQPALQRLREDDLLDEVILSGGDPLSVTDGVLTQLVDELNRIVHLKRIRVHTRFPVVIPSRVTEQLQNWILQSRCAVYFVLHFNHSQEINSEVAVALRKLRLAGATLLNQSVLLRGVNDSLPALKNLCLQLVDNHVVPYYLHQLDPVKGAMHFQVADSTAVSLVGALRRELPGYAVPKLVREIAGEPSKSPIDILVRD